MSLGLASQKNQTRMRSLGWGNAGLLVRLASGGIIKIDYADWFSTMSTDTKPFGGFVKTEYASATPRMG